MLKKFCTLEIDEKNLETSVKASNAEQKKTVSQSEVESFGIVEINNASASKKLKNTAEKGFEKVISGAEKRTVKSELHKVDDYFDFSFKPVAEVKEKETDEEIIEFIREILGEFPEEIVAEEVKEEKSKKAKVVKKATTKKAVAKKATKEESNTSTILKVENEHIEEIRNHQVQIEGCAYDDDAKFNIDIARMCSLFGCEKTMLN